MTNPFDKSQWAFEEPTTPTPAQQLRGAAIEEEYATCRHTERSLDICYCYSYRLLGRTAAQGGLLTDRQVLLLDKLWQGLERSGG